MGQRELQALLLMLDLILNDQEGKAGIILGERNQRTRELDKLIHVLYLLQALARPRDADCSPEDTPNLSGRQCLSPWIPLWIPAYAVRAAPRGDVGDGAALRPALRGGVGSLAMPGTFACRIVIPA